jgi:tetratricopeptide (TPR) repeat protein
MQLTMFADASLDGLALVFTLANGQSLTVKTPADPTHVYGFDLQSLNLAYRHMEEPTKGFEVGLVGVNPHPTPERPEPVVLLGRTRFEYVGEESFGGAVCRKYRMVGPWLASGDGFVWFDRAEGHLAKVECRVPNSSDWTSYRLELTKVERMSPAAWQEFKAGVLEAFTRGSVDYASPMLKAYASGGLEAALLAYERAKEGAKHLERRASEADLNSVAYTLMDGGHAKDAAALLEAAVRELPDSANLYDSLGEAYMKAGDREASIRSYRRSLELDPNNTNARDMLEKLGAGR